MPDQDWSLPPVQIAIVAIAAMQSRRPVWVNGLREAELLPVPYFHIVFSLPAQIADIAYQNKAVIYDILFKASAETLITIAADPKHLGAASASCPSSTPGARRHLP
jgi:hypothetical protein